MLNRRDVMLAGAAMLSTPALAQSQWPNRPVKVLVGFPPGGSNDVMARVMCEYLSPRLGQQFVVENRVGASGNIAAAALAQATPDGYTLGTIAAANATFNHLLFRNMPYDHVNGFTWSSLLWELPNVVVVPARHVPATNLQDFIRWAKEKPGGVNFSSSGRGGTGHQSSSHLMRTAGLNATNIQFRGAAQALVSMLAGDIHVTVDNIASYMPAIRDGSVRALAVADTQRWPALPDVPTVEETGLSGFGSFNAWHILAGPPNMPTQVSDRLVGALREWANDAQARDRVIAMGARLIGASQADTLSFLHAERPRWAERIRLAGYQPE
jgi:tripartite-type tricarboxylate transporter receptor subunit TctC